MQNRRKHERVPIRAQVICIVDTRTMRGVSRNLSQEGMRVEGADLKRADAVQLTFRLDAHALVDAAGAVVWAAERQCGIRFTYVGEQSRRSVRRFIAEHRVQLGEIEG